MLNSLISLRKESELGQLSDWYMHLSTTAEQSTNLLTAAIAPAAASWTFKFLLFSPISTTLRQCGTEVSSAFISAELMPLAMRLHAAVVTKSWRGLSMMSVGT